MSAQSKSKRRTPPPRVVFEQLSIERSKRGLLRDALRPNEERDIAFRRMILSIPVGKVSTYGSVAAAAGYPRYHRAVAKLLRMDPVDQLPWHRILGAGGEIRLRGDAAHEQRSRLKLEGVEFDGKRVNMDEFEHLFKPWEVYGDY
jgi:methylated-DNA-protein-cysteine methyltransferase-like protein